MKHLVELPSLLSQYQERVAQQSKHICTQASVSVTELDWGPKVSKLGCESLAVDYCLGLHAASVAKLCSERIKRYSVPHETSFGYNTH